MSESDKKQGISLVQSDSIILSLLALSTWVLIFFALILPTYITSPTESYRVGEVANQDIVAPRAITYISEIRTEQQREIAARAVAPIYTPPDPAIARRQLERLRATLAYISNVRADAYASIDQKIVDLAALEDIRLDQDTARKLLTLNESRWQAIQQEAIAVLEQVMRSTIREDRLEEVKNDIPALVTLSLPEEQAVIVAKLVAGFVAPNSFYSEALTEAAREQAKAAVSPITRSYMPGETIVRRGQVITPSDLEALQQLDLVQPEKNWQGLVGAIVLASLMLAYQIFYLRRVSSPLKNLRNLVLTTVLFLMFLLAGRFIVPGHTILPYAFPLTAFTLFIGSIYGAKIALIYTLPLTILYTYELPNALTLTAYYLISSIFGVLILGRARRVNSFFWAGAAIGVSGALVIVAYRLPQPSTDLIGVGTLMGTSLLNGIASASLALILQYLLAPFLEITTALQLMEISRPDHPLLQFLLRNAPGTYQHSLQVANLAEQAAERIGADALLTRVGALYHDVGKAVNPAFFIENQVSGSPNPHDDLEAAYSAATIIRHVADGLALARKYRLPRRIADFIAEHHGNMIARYQYAKAVEAAQGDQSAVDIEKFRYPGPRPRSRETAILMLADGCEARIRAEKPQTEEEMKKVIQSVVDNRMSNGQLDDTDLTLRDLSQIVDSFINSLKGIYHPRIEYPQFEITPKLEQDTVPRPSTTQQTPITPLEVQPKA